MDLWIRSQDRENLIQPTRLFIAFDKNIATWERNTMVGLGKYSTKERALEVLDEINEIKYYKYMASLDWKTFAKSVLEPKPMKEQKILLAMMNTYQMPEV